MIALFEIYSTTSRKGKIKPIDVKTGPTQAFDKLVKYFEQKDFLNTKFDRNYFDIFLDDYGYEVSIVIGHDNESSSTIQISVYNPNARGRTRGKLKQYYYEVVALFKDVM